MKISISYQVRLKGNQTSHFSCTGYSKYNERYIYYYKNGFPEDYEVYGLEQAKEHVQELKKSIYEGKKQYEHSIFEIVKVVTTTEVVETI